MPRLMHLALIVHSVLGLPLAVVFGYLGTRPDLDLGPVVRVGVLLVAAGMGLAVWQIVPDPLFESLAMIAVGQLAVAVGLVCIVVGWLLKIDEDHWRRRSDWIESHG